MRVQRKMNRPMRDEFKTGILNSLFAGTENAETHGSRQNGDNGRRTLCYPGIYIEAFTTAV